MMCQSEYLLSPEDLISFSPLVHSFAFKKHPVFFVKTSGVVNLCIPDYQPRYFQNVVLVSCFSDSYGPFDSARVMNSAFQTVCPTEIPTEITGKKPRWRLGTCWECTPHRRLTRKLCRICGKMSLRKKDMDIEVYSGRFSRIFFRSISFVVWCPKVRVTPIEKQNKWGFKLIGCLLRWKVRKLIVFFEGNKIFLAWVEILKGSETLWN